MRKKKKTGQVVTAQRSVVGEETNTRLQNEEMELKEELPTSSTAGTQEGNSQVFVAVCEDSSSMSSENLDSLMM